MQGKHYYLGCDIGGTFTDFCLINEETRAISVAKCLTTPDDPARAVFEGIGRFLNIDKECLSKCIEIIHGTTLVINAIIERKGATTSLLTTAGFRDIIEIGREMRYDVYNFQIEYPIPLIPRHLIFEVNERVSFDGKVIQPLDEKQVASLIDELKKRKVESIAICFLHSYKFPEHERRVATIIKEHWPEVTVSISSEVLPQIEEYERTNTTIVNAYIKRIMDEYLSRIERRLISYGFEGPLYLMLSSGGIIPSETARKFPVRTIESGPAGGVMAAKFYAKLHEYKDLLSFDMGGTTAKLCSVISGQVNISRDYEVGRMSRFKKGSGIPLRVPCFDLIEIGAGGGSIAKVGSLGLLEVGPESAGAVPGPACYNLGGENPTVSDADLILGYLNADYFCGGEIILDEGKAKKAIEDKIARPLKMSIEECSWGIHNIVNENMASAARIHINEVGGDIRKMVLVAFGGAGPVHAFGIAEKLGIRRILIPKSAGVMSTIGFFTSPPTFDLVQTYKVTLDEAKVEEIENIYKTMEKQIRSSLPVGSINEIIYERSIEMRYVGQQDYVDIIINNGDFRKVKKEEILEKFNQTYRSRYTRNYSGVEIEFINLKVKGFEPQMGFKIHPFQVINRDVTKAIKGHRKVFFQESGYSACTVYDRYLLFPDAKFEGPAVLEERESTTVIGHNAEFFVDDYGSIVITRRTGNE
jgi:N-methylhydantoinase A